MDAEREKFTVSWMEPKRVGLLIVLFLYLFVNPAASFPQKPPPKTDYFPQNDSKDEKGMKQNSKTDHPLGHTTVNKARMGNDDGSGSLQGKANFIPIYAAGSARLRHRHRRSSSSCLRSSAGLSSVVGAVTLASLLHLYMET